MAKRKNNQPTKKPKPTKKRSKDTLMLHPEHVRNVFGTIYPNHNDQIFHPHRHTRGALEGWVRMKGRSIISVTTDAGGKAVVVFRSTSNGQFVWDEPTVSAGSYTPDFTTAANHIIDATGWTGIVSEISGQSLHASWIPAAALDAAGGYVVAFTETHIGASESAVTFADVPPKSQIMDVRKPFSALSYVGKEHDLKEGSTSTEDSSNASPTGNIVHLHFFGPASTKLGYLDMTQGIEASLSLDDTTLTVGGRPVYNRPSHTLLQYSLDNLHTAYQGTKDQVRKRIYDTIVGTGKRLIISGIERALSVGTSFLTTYVTGNPYLGAAAGSATNLIMDQVVPEVD